MRGVGGVLSFLPQLAILYLFSEFLEESGIASFLAYETDGFFSLLSLSGRAAFCIFLGYGCTAAGIAASAALENKDAQKRAAGCLYFVPCSAKLPVYLTLLSSLVENPFLGATALYVLGTGAGLLVSSFCGGKEENFIMEIADFYIPSPLFILKKLLFRLKGFIIKVSTTVLAFTACAYTLASVNFSGACAAEGEYSGVAFEATGGIVLPDGRYRLARGVCRSGRICGERERCGTAGGAVSRRITAFAGGGRGVSYVCGVDAAVYRGGGGGFERTWRAHGVEVCVIADGGRVFMRLFCVFYFFARGGDGDFVPSDGFGGDGGHCGLLCT